MRTIQVFKNKANKQTNLQFMGYCSSVFTIQNKRKWPNIATQCCAYMDGRRKDAKLYIVKGSSPEC